MSATSPVNRLLEGLPRKELNRILKSCEPFELVFGDVLSEPNQAYQHVYFPLTGFISLVTTVDNRPPLEMGLIGNEGMLGETLVLGVNFALMQAVVQGPGSALRMSATQFRRILRDSPSLHRTLNHYLYILMAQLAQTAACTRFHEVAPRLARWLLMTHDHVYANHFHLTHQYLANMLGVQRSAVTIAAGVLQRKKLIRYVRGDIRILDRKGLEAASCECYDAIVEDYTRIFA